MSLHTKSLTARFPPGASLFMMLNTTQYPDKVMLNNAELAKRTHLHREQRDCYLDYTLVMCNSYVGNKSAHDGRYKYLTF